MYGYLSKVIYTKVLLIITISTIFFTCGVVCAQVFLANELNIKISQDILNKGSVDDYILFLSNELEKDFKNLDVNLGVHIIKIFLEEDTESPLTWWYKIKFVSEISLDLDDIQRNLLENYEHIIIVEKEYLTKSRLVPKDTAIAHLSYDYYELIGAYEAWDIEKGHEDVIVAIIDSGVMIDHPDLANRFVDQNLFKRYPPDSSIDPDDPTEECYLYQSEIYCFDIYIDSAELDNGVLPTEHDVRDVVPHGTPIAGIIAANHNTFGVPGICPNCKLLPIKTSYLEHIEEQSGQLDPYTEGTSTTGTISSALEYAAKNGADVVNLSMSTSKKSTLLEDTVNELYEKYNCILIAPSDNEDEEGKSYPAAYNNVIGLTAVKVDSQNRVIKRNNAQYGTWIDVVAPGESILSLYLDPSKLKRYSGTSFATPFVTGLAALVRSRDSNFTIHNFRQLLRESSTRIDDPLYDEKKLGYGLINLKRALDKLDDHPWDYSSITQQGNTSSTVSSGGSILLPDNSFFFNPYGTQYAFSPYSSFGNYGVPTYGGFPSLFSNTYSPYIQQPYYYSGSFGFPGQMTQSNTYSPFVVSPFSQFTSGIQRFFPYSGYTILSPFVGGFSGSPFIIYTFPIFGYY